MARGNRADGSVKVFFSLLRAGMYGSPVPEAELPEAIDWEAVIATARKQSVRGTIIEAIPLLPERLRPSAPLAAKLGKFAMGLIQTHVILDRTIAHLVAFFRRHGIEGVLLKGQGVARYYREPHVRQCGDIDFYVGPTVYEQAKQLCITHLIGDSGDAHESEQHFVFMLDGVEVELHRFASCLSVPYRNKRFQQWAVYELEHSPARRTFTLANTRVIVPSYDFDALYIFQHAWHHYLIGGIGLRQLCDWTQVLYSHSQDIDRRRLADNLRRFGLVTGWKLFAWIAVHRLGLPAERMPLYDPSVRRKAERVLAHVLDGGNFGFHSEENSRIFVTSHGLKDELQKLAIVANDFRRFFLLVPEEATFHMLNTLSAGAKNTLKRISRR